VYEVENDDLTASVIAGQGLRQRRGWVSHGELKGLRHEILILGQYMLQLRK
jgi:hypothetical protein